MEIRDIYPPEALLPFLINKRKQRTPLPDSVGTEIGEDFIQVVGSKQTVLYHDMIRYAKHVAAKDEIKTSILANLQSFPVRVTQRDAEEIFRVVGKTEVPSQFKVYQGDKEGETSKKGLKHWDPFMKNNIKFTDGDGMLTDEAKEIMKHYNVRSLEDLFDTMERKGDSYSYGNDTLRTDIQITGWTVEAAKLMGDPSNR